MADDAGATTDTGGDAGGTDTGNPADAFAASYEASQAAEGGDDNKDSGADDATNKDSSDTDQDKDADQGQDDKDSDDKSGDKSSKAEDTDDKSKDDDSDKDEDQDGDKEDEDAKAAHSYEEFTIPEGMKFDDALADKALPILAKHEVPQEAVQEIVDTLAQTQSEFAKEVSDKHNAMTDGWREDTVKQFGQGGDAAFDERSATAQMAMEKFLPSEQREIIAAWGVGNMSGIFAAFETLGNAMKEDGSFSSNAGNSAQEETVADIWYPNSNG